MCVRCVSEVGLEPVDYLLGSCDTPWLDIS